MDVFSSLLPPSLSFHEAKEGWFPQSRDEEPVAPRALLNRHYLRLTLTRVPVPHREA